MTSSDAPIPTADPIRDAALADLAALDSDLIVMAHGASAVTELARAVAQVLDDMGTDGKSCCGLAKAKLRIAYEPFLDEDDGDLMTLKAAQEIVVSAEDYSASITAPKAPDVATVTDEAVEEGMVITHEAIQAALDEAGSAWGPHLYAPMDREILMGAALTAALPHLTAAKDAEIERLKADLEKYMDASADLATKNNRLRKALDEIVLLCNVSQRPWHWIDALLRIDATARAALGDA